MKEDEISILKIYSLKIYASFRPTGKWIFDYDFQSTVQSESLSKNFHPLNIDSTYLHILTFYQKSNS